SSTATSVDSERAFSEGRNQISWNQHCMSSQTFRAQMSLASWSEAPFFDLQATVEALSRQIRPLRAGGVEDL
ncbi:hypothetical protein R3P38DRAFT_2512622, partial [Favolaschia claudopus]